MSKDRQQRREQQASVKDGDKTPERFQVADLAKAQADLPTMTAFELDALGMRLPEVMKRGAGEDDGEFRARLSARLFALLPLPDRTPAEIIEHAERLGGGPPDPFFVRRGDFAGPPRNITINVTANGTEDPEQLSQAILRQVQAQLLMTQDRPTKPPANIPKAVHHLRRAANALAGDAFQGFVLDCARGLIGEDIRGYTQEDRAIMETIAAALDLDHNAKGATKDVRAAIEALR